MSEIPSVRQAQRDLSLKRLPLAAFDVLRDQLDLVRWRPVKLAALEEALSRSRPQVVKAIAELVAHGYIERGDRAWPNGPWTYRLCYSKGEAAVEPPKPPAQESGSSGDYGMMTRGVEW